MATQFISRVERELDLGKSSTSIGPGTYNTSVSSLKTQLPSFAPFSSSSQRVSALNPLNPDSPAPGAYNISTDLKSKNSGAASSFKSKTKRMDISSQSNSVTSNIESFYNVENSYNSLLKKKKFFAPRPSTSGAIPATSPINPPSIPSKFDQSGYEIISSNAIKKNSNTIYTFTGTNNDSVGPGDYTPNPEVVKYKSAPAISFSKSSKVSVLTPNHTNPNIGPGSYDIPSNFDIISSGNTNNANDFLIQMSQSKARPSSVFESKTSRLSTSSERAMEIQKNLPGPGSYHINRELDQINNPNHHANTKKIFIISEERFKENTRNKESNDQELLNYLSDFDKIKLNILKKKKMTNKSMWVNDVGFISTSKRFQENQTVPSTALSPLIIPTHTATQTNNFRSVTPYSAPNGVNRKYFTTTTNRAGSPPPTVTPTSYHTEAFNKTDSYNINYNNILKSSNKIYKEIEEANKKKVSPFGSNSKRFKEKKTDSFVSPMTAKEREINNEINAYFQNKNPNNLSNESFQKKTKKPMNFNVFSPLPEKRLKPVKESLVPAPGTYNITPKWDDVHVPIMIPKINNETGKKIDRSPGPGSYNIKPSLSTDGSNRKNILISTAPREFFNVNSDAAPGPGSYNLSKGLNKPSHNIYLQS